MKRSLAVSILLTVVTCGIYGIFWFITLTEEVNDRLVKRDTSGGMAFLFCLVTCGIYSIYWSYTMGKKIGELKARQGRNESDDAIVYTLLSIFGLDIIVWALVQNEINNDICFREDGGNYRMGNLSGN